MSRVLLVEEGWHSTMYLASGLEAAGFDVTVLTANGTTARCRQRTIEWMSGPPIASSAFTGHLDRLVTSARFEHVLPLTEAAMDRLWDASGAWSDRLFPDPEPWQRRLLRHKHALVEHMALRGLAVPRQYRVAPSLDRAAVVRELGLPVVVKGSIGSGGKLVKIVDTRSALDAAITRTSALGAEWVIQEAIAGPTYLFGGLFRNGEPLRIYAAEKLEQHPPHTGGAIRLRSTHDPALVAAGLRVIAELRWTGFASVDLMRRPDGVFVLLEVNPRLWGSLAGALAAGVELFAPFAALLANEHPGPRLDFAADTECWIFPRYLNDARHRTLAGATRALRDLRGFQGRDWRDPRFVLHILHRLRRLPQLSPRL